MALDEDQINQLVNNPRENLSTELKNWINPDSPEGIAKIVKTAIAMRNNDGGYLLIGFDNKTGAPNLTDAPENVLGLFHTDKIQGLISKYASETFEVFIYYPEIENKKFIIIESPIGVKTPVAAKVELKSKDDKDNEIIHIGVNKVYVRSLKSNHTPSTTEATWKDWPNIIEKCFENREADIGRFLRRHLSNVPSENLKFLLSSNVANLSAEVDEWSLVKKLLDASFERYQTIVNERGISLPEHGAMEVSAIIFGEKNTFSTNNEFLNLISSSNPSYTGWPVWVDSRSFADKSSRPFVYEGFWEAFIDTLQNSWGLFKHLDYWRISPEGKFYLYRAFQDDIGGRDGTPSPGTVLDFGLVLLRAAECVIVAIEFAKAMGYDETAKINFTFRWSGLKNRTLSSWANPSRTLYEERKSYQDKIEANLEVPVDTAKGALSSYVHQLINQLFQAFEGFELSEAVTDDLVKRLLERRLSS